MWRSVFLLGKIESGMAHACYQAECATSQIT